MIRAATYARVSTQEQSDEGSSLDTQAARCRAYCTEHGYHVIAAFSDTHTGAQYRERPGLSRLRELVRARQVDVVVCYALDRLSRNQAHIYIIAEEIADASARLEIVTESFEDSAVGRFLRSAKAFAAEVEREKIAERTVRGKLARIQAGKYNPGPKPPYGYQYRDDTKAALAIDESEALVVRRIYHEYVTGHTMRQITRSLNDSGTPTARGHGMWHQSVVQRMLTNPAYAGDGHAWLFSTSSNTRHWDLAIPYPAGTVPPIVERHVWQAAQERLRSNKLRSVRNAHEPEAALLRGGFAVCGYCGYTLIVERQSRQRPYIYRCRSPRHRAGENGPQISVVRLDGIVWSRIVAALQQPDAATWSDAPPAAPPDTTPIDRALADVDRASANLSRAIAQLDDPLMADPLVEQLRTLGQRKRRLLAERENAERQHAAIGQRRQAIMDVIDLYGDHLDALTWSQRREVLNALGVVVTVWHPQHDPRTRIASRLL